MDRAAASENLANFAKVNDRAFAIRSIRAMRSVDTPCVEAVLMNLAMRFSFLLSDRGHSTPITTDIHDQPIAS